MTDIEIIERAEDIADPGKRKRFLDESCGGDLERRSRIEQMLSARASDIYLPGGQAEEPIEFPSEDAPPRPEQDSYDHYKVVRYLGSGSFGTVWQCWDQKLERPVAIKVPHADAMPSREAAQVLQREAQALAALGHPNLVTVHAFGTTRNGQPYIVCQFIAGSTLEQRLKHRRPTVVEAARTTASIARAVAHVHGHGRIHRDIKPANILIEDKSGTPYLCDLGIAIKQEESLAEAQSAGTASYMTPEQVRAGVLDKSSDVFALGSVLYEMLTGTKAFDGKSTKEILEQVSMAKPMPPRSRDPSIPARLEQICMKALAHQKADRYPSAALMADELEAWIALTTRSPLSYVFFGTVLFALIALAGWSTLRPFASNQKTITLWDGLPLQTALDIESVEVTPFECSSDDNGLVTGKELSPLTKGMRQQVTTQHAIDVKARLSRPAYTYIVLYRADGDEILLYPYQEDEAPTLADEAGYPPPGKANVVYQLNDGPGVWAISVIASESPLPGFSEWKANHPPAPWTAQPDPAALASVVIDDGSHWSALASDGTVSRGSRGEISIERRVPIRRLLDYWQDATRSSVKIIAFPVSDQ